MSTAIDKRVLDVASLNSMSREEFVAAVGSTFEHSPWVAEQEVVAENGKKRTLVGVAISNSQQSKTAAAR